jgi:hypothetical protein
MQKLLMISSIFIHIFKKTHKRNFVLTPILENLVPVITAMRSTHQYESCLQDFYTVLCKIV